MAGCAERLKRNSCFHALRGNSDGLDCLLHFLPGFENPFFACWRVTSFACAKEVTKKTHPGALALRASLAEWLLLQGRFDARPCLSKLKWPSMAILPWQMPLCEATLMGKQNQKKLQQPKLKAK
jgi:hypothetical protein